MVVGDYGHDDDDEVGCHGTNGEAVPDSDGCCGATTKEMSTYTEGLRDDVFLVVPK